jgi:hypothetical protein
MNDVYTFKPKISDSSSPKLENFFSRLQIWIKNQKEKAQKGVENSLKDSKTGQTLFQPWVPNKDSETIILTNRNIHLDLYEESRKLRHQQEEAQNNELNQIKKNSKTKASSQRSDEINKQQQEECFFRLFQFLDHDDDKIIFYNEEFERNMMRRLPEELRRLLEPIINELKDHNESLTFEEFLLAIKQLFYVLNVHQKRTILTWYTSLKREESPRKKREELEFFKNQMTFCYKPTVTESSNRVFSNSKRHQNSFIDRNLELLRSREDSVKRREEEKIRNELIGKEIYIYNRLHFSSKNFK